MDKPLIHYDKRIVRRSIGKEYLTKEEYNTFINALPDRAADAEPLDLEEEVIVAPAAPPEIGEGTGAPAEGEPETPVEAASPEEEPAPLPDGENAPETGAGQEPDEDPVENKEGGA